MDEHLIGWGCSTGGFKSGKEMMSVSKKWEDLSDTLKDKAKHAEEQAERKEHTFVKFGFNLRSSEF